MHRNFSLKTKVTYHNYIESIVFKHLKRFTQHKDCARKLKDIEDVHQVRVATRRLRTAFWVFKNAFPKRVIKHWNEDIRGVAKSLGRARDLDVQIDFLKDLVNMKISPQNKAGLEKMFQLLQEKRQAQQIKVIAALDKLDRKETINKIIKDLPKILDKKKDYPNKKLFVIARRKITKRLKIILLIEPLITQPDKIEELHLLRIAAKKLRYTMETFEPLYGKRMEFFIESAKSIQQVLGQLHDFDIWIANLPRNISEKGIEKELSSGITYYLNRCRKLRNQTYDDFVQKWNNLKEENVWDELIEFSANPYYS